MKRNNNIPRNIRVNNNRYFINISKSGCGNGCKYCYVKGASSKQELLSLDKVELSLKYIEKHKNFSTGNTGSLISLCPDTEPFKSEKSEELIIQVLKKFLPLGNPIQISTKQKTPEKILQIISCNQVYQGQVVLFISSNTISRHSEIEPFADGVEKRFTSFIKCKEMNITTCLYIKPITHLTLSDTELYIKMIHKYQPDYICAGILYDLNNYNEHNKYAHPAHTEIKISYSSLKNISDFKSRISKRISIPIFHSSICVSAYARDYYPSPHIWEDFKELCINCRDCNYQYNKELLFLPKIAEQDSQ